MDRCGVFNGAEMSRFRHVRASALLISHRAWHRYRYREQNAKSISTLERQKRNSTLCSYGRFRHFKCSHEKLSVQSRGIFAMEFSSLDFESTSGRTRQRAIDIWRCYEIFNGLCECLWFSFSSPEYAVDVWIFTILEEECFTQWYMRWIIISCKSSTFVLTETG